MNYEDLFTELTKNRDTEQAKKMSVYMRGQFSFLGIPTPKRKAIYKEHFKVAKKEKDVDWKFVNSCWEQDYREFQYIAVDYLVIMQKKLIEDDVAKIKKLIVTKSWWDTVDGLDRVVGDIALIFPVVNDILLEWSADENFWLRRIAIDHQLCRKNKTNTELLENIIVNNLNQTEFFINKAIGWSLREYSKTDPEWVRNFIEKYREGLASLSIREASKYLEVENNGIK